MKQDLHTGHLGNERAQLKAKSTMHWPKNYKDINEMISNCNSCHKFWNLHSCEPLLSQKIPKDVYNKEGNDLFARLSILYLIVIDYTGKCFRLAQLPNTSSNTVITHMISIFRKHSIPKVIFSDNRPQYSSQSFKTFSKSWDFTQRSSIPKFPQSNRFLERAIQTITKILTKCKEDDSHLYLTMLSLYINSSSGISPSELLMKWKLRTLVPLLNVNVNTNMKLKMETVIQSGELQPLKTSSTVRYYQNNNWTQTGMILNNNNMSQLYTLLNDKDNVTQRNRSHHDEDELKSH